MKEPINEVLGNVLEKANYYSSKANLTVSRGKGSGTSVSDVFETHIVSQGAGKGAGTGYAGFPEATGAGRYEE